MMKISDNIPFDLTIGILTWNAPCTLRNTLMSYDASGLLECAKKVIVFLQGNNPKEKRIVQEFGLNFIDSEDNIGIQAGIERLLSMAESEFFLFLENDWVCVESPQVTRFRIGSAIDLLRDGVAQCVLMRHKYFYGKPLHSLQFKGREWEKPQHFLSCVHWVTHPDKKFPDIFNSVRFGEDDYVVTDSRFANYTNNPCVYATDFFRRILALYTDSKFSIEDGISQNSYAAAKGVSSTAIALEGNIQSWWEEQRFAVAQGVGLFRHDRKGEAVGFRASVKQFLKSVVRNNSHSSMEESPVRQIAFVCAHRVHDTATVSISLAREFKRRGWQVRFFSLFDEHDSYHDENLKLLYASIRNNWYRPDIVFHLDYTGFRSRYFAKIKQQGVFTVFESSDDPKRFVTNYPKAKDFHLILTPDYSSMVKYRKRGHRALWWTHFADDTIYRPFEVPQSYVAVCTRGKGSSAVMDRLVDEHPDLFVNRSGLVAEAHSKFLCSGKIVLQHSRDKEITRRIFEGMACGRMVLTDRLPPITHISELFVENEDIVYYDDFYDCVNKIKHYSSSVNDAERGRIAANGFLKTLAYHTQKKRVDVIADEFLIFKTQS